MKPLQKFRKCVRQAGFSIVELMVAILIGLIILAGVIQVVISSKTTFMGQEEMSFIQENARYAMDVIGKDIQGAGYWGCAGSNPRVALVAGVNESNAQYFLGTLPLEGYAGQSGAPAAYVGNLLDLAGGGKSESLLVRSFTGPAYTLRSHEGTTLKLVDDEHKIPKEGYVGIVAEDCRRIGIFRAGDVTANTITYSINDNYGIATIKPDYTESIICPGALCTNAYNQIYSQGSELMQYMARAYYLGTSSAIPGFPALKRSVLNSSGSVEEEEIALGVEDMHFRYGVRDGGQLRYFTAADVPDWMNVVSVEVTLLMRAQSPTLPFNESKSIVDGRTYNDRHMRQIVTSTFKIRNRI
jgi:type IV pilus assembly protein PilW